MPKHAVEVEVRDSRGEMRSGAIYLAAQPDAEFRHERLKDVLADRPFIPMKMGGAMEFVSRRHVVWLKLDLIAGVDELDFEAEGAEGSVAIAVRIDLADGSLVQGTLRYYRPEGSRRLSDYLSDVEPWFPVRTDDWLFLVSREHVLRVVALDEVKP